MLSGPPPHIWGGASDFRPSANHLAGANGGGLAPPHFAANFPMVRGAKVILLGRDSQM